MIMKKRGIPLKIRKLEALARRLPDSHPASRDVQAELDRSRAGHRGEEALDYHLAFLRDREPMMFHGLRLLGDNGYFFQIDTLLLYPNMAVILETKNIAGTLFFEQAFHQLIRIQEAGEAVFSDPLLQVSRQKRQLQAWLASQHFTDLPIAPLVVISFPSTKITADPHHKEAFRQVLHAAAIPEKIKALHLLHPAPVWTEQERERAARRLLASHTPHHPDVLEKFQIAPAELFTGVQCPACRSLPMLRARGRWQCPRCRHQSCDAHVQALTDYSLLHERTITNRACRAYLQLDSRSTATRLLKQLQLPYTGSLKDRKYLL